jgi:hypothetical protein
LGSTWVGLSGPIGIDFIGAVLRVMGLASGFHPPLVDGRYVVASKKGAL